MAKRTAFYIVQVWTALFYSFIVPMGAFTEIFIFSIYFWVDKYNLFKKSSHNIDYQLFLATSVTRLFELSLLPFTIGNLVFSFYSHGSHFHYINFISLGIAGLFSLIVILSSFEGIKRLYRVHDTIENYTYESCIKAGKFQETFWG